MLIFYYLCVIQEIDDAIRHQCSIPMMSEDGSKQRERQVKLLERNKMALQDEIEELQGKPRKNKVQKDLGSMFHSFAGSMHQANAEKAERRNRPQRVKNKNGEPQRPHQHQHPESGVTPTSQRPVQSAQSDRKPDSTASQQAR